MDAGVARRRRAVAGTGAVFLLLAGLLYAWSIFVTPLEEEFGWVRSQTSLTYTISVGCNTIFALLGARLCRRIGPRWVVRLAAAGVLAGFLLASRTRALWQLYVSYGIICAGSLGMIYNVVISTAVRWFPEKTGAISGALLMCYGLGTMAFGSLVSRLMETGGWRLAFLCLGIGCGAVLLSGSFLLRNPDSRESATLPAVPTGGDAGAETLACRQMLGRRSFWTFALWNLLLATLGLVLTSHASPMAESLGISPTTAALYVGVVSLSNGVSRLLCGALFDRLGRKRTMAAVSVLGLLGSATLLLAYHMGWKAGLLLAFFLLGVSFGGSPVCSANYIKTMYGSRNFAENLAVGNLPVLVAAYIGPYFAGVIYQIAGYALVCAVMIALGVLGVLVSGLLWIQGSGRQTARKPVPDFLKRT